MLYQIIKQLQQTSSTNEKLLLMQEHKDFVLFKEYMRWATCPSLNYYVTEKTFPKPDKVGTHTFESLAQAGYSIFEPLTKRIVTGKALHNFIKQTLEDLDIEYQELYKLALLKDIRAKIGVTLVNKVWPSLCVDIPYQRCSLPDKKKLDKFAQAGTFVVQTKGDGMYAAMVVDKTQWDNDVSIYTRNGNKFPKWFGWHISDGLDDNQSVYEGELLCFRDGKLLSRKEGNGILNSIMQGSDKPEGVSVQYHVWNRLPIEDWKAGKTDLPYSTCLRMCFQKVRQGVSTGGRVAPKNMFLIDCKHVSSLEEAYAFNQEQLAKGLEGSIIKTLTHKWKNGTSSECLKLKVEAEVDLIWYDSVEGKGKASGMLGAMKLRSACGKLEVDVGSGMTDKQRKELWEQREQLHGSVVTVKCNDALSREGSDKLSLFLPILVEVRADKDTADDVERIHSILDAAKGIV